MILLVHSCDGREKFLDVWHQSFDRWAKRQPDIASKIDILPIAGHDAFCDQLIRVLKDLDCEYVWHILDDYWIVDECKQPFDRYYEIAQEYEVDALRIQPNVQFDSLPYHFTWEYGFMRQTNESSYQVSFASSIWRREFLLKCLIPGLNPWEMEVSEMINDWDHKIYFWPKLPFWYINGTIKGELTKQGKEWLNTLKKA